MGRCAAENKSMERGSNLERQEKPDFYKTENDPLLSVKSAFSAFHCVF